MANTENAKLQQPAQVRWSVLLADIERAINHAYESGYISGHNDTCEGCFNNDTAEVAKDRAAEIVQAITAHLSANDPKLSDGGTRRATCVVCGKAEAEAGSVTCGAVRCSAWLGVFGNGKKLIKVLQKCIVWLLVSCCSSVAFGNRSDQLAESFLRGAGDVSANHISPLDERRNHGDECATVPTVTVGAHVEPPEIGLPSSEERTEFASPRLDGGLSCLLALNPLGTESQAISQKRREGPADDRNNPRHPTITCWFAHNFWWVLPFWFSGWVFGWWLALNTPNVELSHKAERDRTP